MADKEEIKTLEELEEKGRILREYKEKFRQMCQENKMIKGSTVLKLYDKIEEIQREYEHLDNKLTLSVKINDCILVNYKTIFHIIPITLILYWTIHILICMTIDQIIGCSIICP